jgi:cytochrome bd-type quinol oxidase subunit 2
MEETAQSSVKATLPVILIAALVEGWGLYGLHHAIKGHHWPATSTAWLVALYAVVVFGPLTAQLLARYARDRLCPAVSRSSAQTGCCGWLRSASCY